MRTSGWMPDVIDDRHYSHVGATTNMANLGAAGVFATLTVVLVRTLPAVPAAGLLGLTMMAPTAMLFFIPLPAKPTRGAAEMFRSFFGDLHRVCKRPGCVVGLICFVSPTACFALTNLFSGMGRDFHTPERWVTALNGPGVAIACSVGCLAGIWFCGRFLRRNVYISDGIWRCGGGAGADLDAAHVRVFCAGVLAYNFFQGINYTAFTALCFEIVGPSNPLASTQIALLAAASNLPISYMTAVDGHFHTTHGLSGNAGRGCLVEPGGGDGAAAGVSQDGSRAPGRANRGYGTRACRAWIVWHQAQWMLQFGRQSDRPPQFASHSMEL